MSTDEKLLEKILEKPTRNDITIDELISVAPLMGFEVCGGGKHPIKLYHINSGRVIPIPVHGKCVKSAYICQVVRTYEELFKEEIRS